MIRLEEYGRIVAIALVLSFLIGLALQLLAVGHDGPDVTGSYRAGLLILQHHLDVGGCPVHDPVFMVPVPTSYLRTDNCSMPIKAKRKHRRRVVVPTIDNDQVVSRGEPLEVKRDACTVAAASEDYGSWVVATDAVAFPFKLIRITLRLGDWYLPRAEILLRKAVQSHEPPRSEERR